MQRCRELMKGNMSSLSKDSKNTAVLAPGAFMQYLREISDEPRLYSAELFTNASLRQKMLSDPLTLVSTLTLPLGPSENG